MIFPEDELLTAVNQMAYYFPLTLKNFKIIDPSHITMFFPPHGYGFDLPGFYQTSIEVKIFMQFGFYLHEKYAIRFCEILQPDDLVIGLGIFSPELTSWYALKHGFELGKWDSNLKIQLRLDPKKNYRQPNHYQQIFDQLLRSDF